MLNAAWNGNARLLSEADRDAQHKVLATLAGGTSVGISSYSNPNKFVQTQYGADFGSGAMQISVNQNSWVFDSSNYYELSLVLYHEKVHQAQDNAALMGNLYPCEQQAYLMMMCHADFTKCSQQFQTQIKNEALRDYGIDYNDIMRIY